MGVQALKRRYGVHGPGGNWVWAFVSQGASSATSLALTVVAGRVLGTSGLGIVFAGFSAYILVLSLHRAVITTPLIASTAARPVGERSVETRSAFTATSVYGLVAGGLMSVAGLVVPGPIGRGLLVFSPWIALGVCQDLFRSTLFRDGRGRRAALTDVSWLVTVAVLLPLVVQLDSLWAVVGAWGLGAVVAASLGAGWAGVVPARLSASRVWLVEDALPFGRWLALQQGMATAGSYALVVVLTAVLGTSDVGGIRAAETIFGPFSLVAPALTLVGLPALARAITRSRRSALSLATGISASGLLVVVFYSAAMLVAGSYILRTVFGEEFEAYDDLILPMSVWQIALVAGIGFGILLNAQQRGTVIVAISALGLVVTLVATTTFSLSAGVEGAVWGMALGRAVTTTLAIVWSFGGPWAVVPSDAASAESSSADPGTSRSATGSLR